MSTRRTVTASASDVNLSASLGVLYLNPQAPRIYIGAPELDLSNGKKRKQSRGYLSSLGAHRANNNVSTTITTSLSAHSVPQLGRSTSPCLAPLIFQTSPMLAYS